MDRLNKNEWCIHDVSQVEALDMVRKWHYAKGGSNTAVYRHGLFRIGEQENPLGVAWWLPPTKVAAQSVSDDWKTVLSLTRLVIAPEVPKNAATFLLGRSMREIRAEGKWKTLVTYADEGQGHTGAIYRASNWEYVGTRPGSPVWLDPDGRQVATKAGPRTRTRDEMLELGYVNTGPTRKHKFVMRLN